MQLHAPLKPDTLVPGVDDLLQRRLLPLLLLSGALLLGTLLLGALFHAHGCGTWLASSLHVGLVMACTRFQQV